MCQRLIKVKLMSRFFRYSTFSCCNFFFQYLLDIFFEEALTRLNLYLFRYFIVLNWCQSSVIWSYVITFFREVEKV